MNYFLGGVNGSGKTTLLEALKRERPDWTFIKGSSVLMEHLGIADDYVALRNIPPEQANRAFADMMGQLLDGTTNNLVLDGHYLNLVRGEVRDVIAGSWIQKFDALLLIEAPIEDVCRRLEKDSVLRDRELFESDCSDDRARRMLQNYQQQTREKFFELAEKFHKPHLLIENREGAIEDAVKAFLEFDRGLRA